MAESVLTAQSYLVKTSNTHPSRLEGQTFGRLTALYFAGHDKRKEHAIGLYACRCECGNEVVVASFALKHGNTRSCGCMVKKPVDVKREMHGGHDKPEYDVWQAMKARCERPQHKDYADYGGRGITVCDRWRHSFAAFMEDMGERPTDKHTLERRRVNEGYSPDNCYWLPWSEQNWNRRDTVYVEYKGEKIGVAKLAHQHGIPPYRLHGRLKNGWSVEDALTTPVNA
jgi:hypothetical protein